MRDRASVLDRLAGAIAASRARRVAVDGADASGKTTLADELAPLLEARGQTVERLSVDEFLRPPEERHRRGRDSPLGYYLDSFDHDALRAEVDARPRAVLVDGVFLLRPELRALWDFRVFVAVDFGELLRRGIARDGGATRGLYLTRYLPAQRRYLAEVEPELLADAVLENTDPAAPVLRLR